MDLFRALPATVLALVPLMAGCASPGDGEPAPATPSATYSVVGDNRVSPVLVSDTYHLLAQPDVAPRAPTGTETVRVPVGSAFAPTKVTQPSDDAWRLVLPHDVGGLVGTARLWVEVKGPLLGNPFSGVTGGCFWSLDVAAQGEEYGLACLPEEMQVREGVHELVFTFAHADRAYPAGTVLALTFEALEWVERSPGTTVEVLTGSAEFDSSVQLYGLELPLDEGLLLAA